jgi:hypothetical protein
VRCEAFVQEVHVEYNIKIHQNCTEFWWIQNQSSIFPSYLTSQSDASVFAPSQKALGFTGVFFDGVVVLPVLVVPLAVEPELTDGKSTGVHETQELFNCIEVF